ncbi:MAG: hypothetical protein JRE23_15735, partial [Deltaproteobacteria bacterium]|nr:hypothetical protein [Deltaproteobacteria bacterium]
LKNHPGYLKNYRKDHPDYVENNRQRQKLRHKVKSDANDRANHRVDIQDTLMMQPTANDADRLKFLDVDIQDAIRGQVIVPVYVNECLGGVDIQDEMVITSISRYTSAIMIRRQRLEQFKKGFLL